MLIMARVKNPDSAIVFKHLSDGGRAAPFVHDAGQEFSLRSDEQRIVLVMAWISEMRGSIGQGLTVVSLFTHSCFVLQISLATIRPLQLYLAAHPQPLREVYMRSLLIEVVSSLGLVIRTERR
jgi:hypothetical protein